MQNEKSSIESKQVSNAPVEIDAALLHLVAGGAPKGTWNEPTVEAQLSSAQSDTSAPKGTW